MDKPDVSGLSDEQQAYIAELEKANETLAMQLLKSTEVIEELSEALQEETRKIPYEGEEKSEPLEQELDMTKSDDLDEVLKANPLLKARLDKMAEAVAKAEQRARAAEEAIAKARDEAERKDWIAKASRFDALAVDHEVLGSLLHKVSKSLGGEDTEALVKVLEAANAQAESGALFSELGKSTPDGSPASTFYGKNTQSPFELEVHKHMAANKVDYATAVSAVAKANPALYLEHAEIVRKGA